MMSERGRTEMNLFTGVRWIRSGAYVCAEPRAPVTNRYTTSDSFVENK